MILERIKRKIEPGMFITPQSTPIVYFGEFNNAISCTISLNPSDKEFINNSGKLLDLENMERLCSRKKLKVEDNVVLSDNEANIVLKYCDEYFQRKPYKIWFDPFDYVIKKLGNYSYYNGSCVNLDLIQWATTPKWDKVPEDIRNKHLEYDLPFLRYLLLEKNFEVMFLNGKTVAENIEKHLNIVLNKKQTTFINSNNIERKLTIYTGKYRNMNIIGWNIYLTSPELGGYKNKEILCNKIKEYV
jgi:hypothetical protein